MAKPPTSVRSIRLPDALWAVLAADAARQGETINSLVAKAVVKAEMEPGEEVPRLSPTQINRLADMLKPGRIVRVADDDGPRYMPLRMPKAPIGSRLDKKAKR